MLVPKIRAKYYCPDCESWFDEPYFIEWDEPREFWGMPYSEHLAEWHCPYCDSDYILDESDLVEDDEMEEE